MQVSPSRLRTFGNCANQYKYKYVLQLGGDQVGALTVAGSVIHYALEVHDQFGQNLQQALDTFDYYWNNPKELGETIDYYPPRVNHESIRSNAHEMIRRYHDSVPWKKGKLIGTEIRFEVPLGRHTLRGIIDRLDLRANRLEIIDHKTGSYIPKNLRHDLQFTSYLYATTQPEFWEQVPGDYAGFWEEAETLPRFGIWHDVRNNKTVHAGERTVADYHRLELAVNQMEAALEADVYPLSISGDACGWCAWSEICGTEIEKENA